jgi:hypothetical protein
LWGVTGTLLMYNNHSEKVSQRCAYGNGVIFFFFESGLTTAAQAGLKLMILLPQPPKCWDYRHATLCLARFLSLSKMRMVTYAQYHVWILFIDDGY